MTDGFGQLCLMSQRTSCVSYEHAQTFLTVLEQGQEPPREMKEREKSLSTPRFICTADEASSSCILQPLVPCSAEAAKALLITLLLLGVL